MFVVNPKKYVLVTDANPWTGVLMSILEQFGSLSDGWGMSARVVDKATAAEFLSRGMMHVQCTDPDVATNLRYRHREGYFVPSEFPEQFSLKDQVLIVKRRSPDEDVPAGHDNRYHFFLVTAEDPETMARQFADQGEASTTIEVRGSKRKCGSSGAKAAARQSKNARQGRKTIVQGDKGSAASASRHGQKHRSGKGPKRNTHRWRF